MCRIIEQMDDDKKTKVSVDPSKAVGAASQSHGANINAVAFNIDLIARKRPTKAVEVLRLYEELSSITADSPDGPDEDSGLANQQISDFIDI